MPDDHKCPFLDGERYNADLNGGKGFTIKEIIIDMQRRMNKFDTRVNSVETKIAYITGGMALLGIAIALARWL